MDNYSSISPQISSSDAYLKFFLRSCPLPGENFRLDSIPVISIWDENGIRRESFKELPPDFVRWIEDDEEITLENPLFDKPNKYHKYRLIDDPFEVSKK